MYYGENGTELFIKDVILTIIFLCVVAFSLWAWSQNKKRDLGYKLCCEQCQSPSRLDG